MERKQFEKLCFKNWLVILNYCTNRDGSSVYELV